MYCKFEEIYCQFEEKYCKFEAKYYNFDAKCTRNLLKYIARLKVVLNCTRNILPALRNLHEELFCQNIFWVLKCARFRYKYFSMVCGFVWNYVWKKYNSTGTWHVSIGKKKRNTKDIPLPGQSTTFTPKLWPKKLT